MSSVKQINAGQTYVEPTQTAGGGDVLPPYMRDGAWNYTHAPGAWEWCDAKNAFLPVLGRVSRSPGANGVTKDGDMSFALANLAQKGATVIKPNDPRLGEHAGYLIAYPCAGGGSHHAHRGSTFTVVPNGRVIAQPVGSFDDFRAAVAASGIIGGLDEWVYNAIREREYKALERIEGEYAKNGGDFRKEKVLARRERVARMEAAWKQLTEQAPAKPARKVTVRGAQEADL